MGILGDRRRGRGSIRTRLTAVVVVSAVALVAMWVAVSMPRLYDAIYLRGVTDAMQDVMPRAVKALTSIEQERAQSLLQVASGTAGPGDRRAQTDQAVRGVRELVEPVLAQSPRFVQDKYAEFTRTLDQLGAVRGRLDAKSISRSELYDFYNRLADASITVFDAMAHAVPDQETAFSGIEVNSLFRAAEEMSRSSTIISAAITTGALNSADHAEFARLSGAYRQQLEMSIQNSSTEVKARYQDLRASDPWKRLTAAEDKLIATGPWTVVTTRNRGDGQLAAPPVSDQEWQDVTGKVYGDVEQLGVHQFAESSRLAGQKASKGLTVAIVGSVIALLVAIATIIAALRIMRTTTRRLTRLRYETLDLAVEKLPPIVQRLRAGEEVDVATELPALDFGRDEIGQVARAFNAAHTTAVEAAVQESQARTGVRNVFLGIAHRSQALVHRQLKILDRLEREEEDPQQLDELFHLDHLATRARRNAENLIILGGQQPGRIWRRPVLLVDILRGAVAETTQYKRVRLQGVPRVYIVGSAVADTMHLLAELLDNATSFSPPQAQVRLSGEPAARGILLEVEDNGLGMEDTDRDRHNAVLADPPDFDAMALKGDPRLGLFVVARLAARHGIRVELRSSSYGGTRAIVLIPATLLAEDEQESTAVLDPVTVGPPGSDFVGDVLPFRIPQAQSGASATAIQVEERPAWPPQDVPDEVSPEVAAQPTEPEIAKPRAAEPPGGVADDKRPAAGLTAVDDRRPALDDQGRPALPRRRRQASLAPQLREAAFTPEEPEIDPADGRSPDEIRNIMSAFHRESRRARADGTGENE
ncbi:sensor histidine kinase [Actinocrispum wychmicini]|uniref:histidine kinase n=1 Tax=Actinocrispum wychmicini TaxID=1213861 RepID=A0A4R2J7G4_9PSEU|nr:nitrate- and nitrite sensing domain-containing protein [Actinocrispum wychmicini]TCO52468.1 signal transduction histidine kinase [Actinocrispum wychmicini]